MEVDSLTRQEALSYGVELMKSFVSHQIITANALLLLEAQKSPVLQKACREASLILPDSAGVSWAALTLRLSRLHRFPGIDYAFELCGLAESLGIPVYLLGGQPGVQKKAARYLYSHYPNLVITGMRDGFFQARDERSIMDDIGQSRARLVLVAMGMGKQEVWINQHLSALPPAVYIGIGGSFDVWAGNIQRAPGLLQKSGLEWAYRLKQEPFRWKRINQLPKFALKVFLNR